MSFEAEVRSVRGVRRLAATAKAAVMPGMIWKGMLWEYGSSLCD